MLHSTFTCQGTTARSHWQRSGASARMCTKTGGIRNKKKNREREKESDYMLTWCLCLSVWFNNSISVRRRKPRSCGEAFRGPRSNPHLGPPASSRYGGSKRQTETHLSDIRAYLTSLRIMAPFRGCHRVQCCVMRLFTLNKKKKKSDKHVLKNSAWNKWRKTLYIPVFVKARLPLCTPFFFLSHIVL